MAAYDRQNELFSTPTLANSGRSVTTKTDEFREKMLNTMQGNPGMLSVAGAGGALASLPPEVLDAIIAQILAEEGGS
jgi:hypothetical protein